MRSAWPIRCRFWWTPSGRPPPPKRRFPKRSATPLGSSRGKSSSTWTCCGLSISEPRPMVTSAARTRISPGNARTRRMPCATRLASRGCRRWGILKAGLGPFFPNNRKEGRMSAATKNVMSAKKKAVARGTDRFDVKDLAQAEKGRGRIEWAGRSMPVLQEIHQRFEKTKPLKGMRMAACLHITSETANLALALKAGGAEVALCASNPLSTQDDVAAALATDYGIPTFAIKGEDHKTYYRHIAQVLELKPNLTMDDGADLVSVLHSDRQELLEHVVGGTEETT